MLKQLIKLSFYQQLIILSVVAFTIHISALKLLHIPVFDNKSKRSKQLPNISQPRYRPKKASSLIKDKRAVKPRKLPFVKYRTFIKQRIPFSRPLK